MPPRDRFHMFITDLLTSLPAPPLNAVANNRIADPVAWIFGSVVVFAFGQAVQDWRKSGQPTSVLLLMGGGLTFLLEPLLNIAGGCWHPVLQQRVVVSLIGRPLPLWLLMCYVAYFGAQPIFVLKLFRSGLGRRAIWLLFVIPLALDVALERAFVSLGLYSFYGNQPLDWDHFPLWWSPVNSVSVLAALLATTRLASRLRGLARIGLLFAAPFAYISTFMAVAFPSLIAVNTDLPRWVTDFAGLLTCGLTVASVALFARRPVRVGVGADSCARLTGGNMQ